MKTLTGKHLAETRFLNKRFKKKLLTIINDIYIACLMF